MTEAARFRIHSYADESIHIMVTKEMACMSLLIKDMITDDDGNIPESDEIVSIPLVKDVTQVQLDQVKVWMEFFWDKTLETLPKPIPEGFTFSRKDEKIVWILNFMDALRDKPPTEANKYGWKRHHDMLLITNYLDMADMFDYLMYYFGVELVRAYNEKKCCVLGDQIMTRPQEMQIRHDYPWIFDLIRVPGE